MSLNSEITKRIEEIRQDKIHGARWLTGQALDIMKLAIEKSEVKTKAGFVEEISETGRQLAGSRPSMASITNMVSLFVCYIQRLAEMEDDLDSLKDQGISGSNELVRSSEEAFQQAIVYGASMIEKGDRVMTCSYSSTVGLAFKTAKIGGKEFSVLVAESVFNGTSYGDAMLNELKFFEIEAELIPDRAIEDSMQTVNKLVVGADSLLSDGSLINGIPTAILSQAAKESGIPFYALSETVKFDARGYLGQSVELEEGFDCVPPHLITGIISEQGIIKPREVEGYIKKMAVYIQALFED